MKTTKFRAWHNGQMYDVNTLGLNLKGINPGMSFAHKEHQSSLKMRQDCIMFDEETIFMQFTGLKDKNDKEIYESDIIKYIGDHGDNYESIINYEGNGFSIPDYLIKDNNKCECEITGNIYKNQELL